MKLQLDGFFDVAATPREAFSFLTDAQRFAPLLPMFRELRDVDGPRFTVVLEMGVPQVRGRVEAAVMLAEQQPDTRARYTSSARHALGMADSEIGFELAPHEGGTRVTWRAETLVRGTLASIANGVLMPLAKRNVQSMIEALRDALGATPSVRPGAVSAARRGWFARLLAFLGIRGSSAS